MAVLHLTLSQNELLEAIPLLDGVIAVRSDKKECKEEHSIKIFQPANKNFTPLFLASDSEQEIAEWFKDIGKAETIRKISLPTPNHTSI